ncbi:prepilin-type N-terminal cleavage/methylation domain-containing protein [Geomonas sp. RF6]|uniref:type IV pilin protein n=1 Tax=Geomonas sp. RF6 TaxID=2897342 RepID=UPI001E387281|nr:prepilin-type N-terminal cleavage/methylation domain-containing protein [Geomonas sp. RF6]UFS70867.1 prepilin-type N-terminal cleavage/methylation domain-containing protein [Geomonas sp. RF6]
MFKRLWKAQRGFTLIELMIVVTIIGILAAIAAPSYQWGIIRAREAVLREDLYSLRTTLDQYFADQGKYPDSLEELKEKKYLREIPKDPFTRQSDWKTISPQEAGAPEDVKGSVGDVKSNSDLVDRNGTPYKDY